METCCIHCCRLVVQKSWLIMHVFRSWRFSLNALQEPKEVYRKSLAFGLSCVDYYMLLCRCIALFLMNLRVPIQIRGYVFPLVRKVFVTILRDDCCCRHFDSSLPFELRCLEAALDTAISMMTDETAALEHQVSPAQMYMTHRVGALMEATIYRAAAWHRSFQKLFA